MGTGTPPTGDLRKLADRGPPHELQVATFRAQVSLDSYRRFENFYDFERTEKRVASLTEVFDQVLA